MSRDNALVECLNDTVFHNAKHFVDAGFDGSGNLLQTSSA